jgi:hypothetical protein
MGLTAEKPRTPRQATINFGTIDLAFVLGVLLSKVTVFFITASISFLAGTKQSLKQRCIEAGLRSKWELVMGLRTA